MTDSIENLAAFASHLADASGKVIRPYFRTRIDVTDKSAKDADYDPVTIADQEAETVIRKLIKKRYPDHGILGEEHGHEQGRSDLTWVLDPIDGTRAFISGTPQWGTLIGLNDGKKPVVGVLDQPYTRERWIGHSGTAQFTNSENTTTIKTRACIALKEAVVTTTHPTGYFNDAEQKAFQALTAHARMSRFGGDCYAYGLLAMGFIDLIVEASLKPWDVQALIPIIEGAGGVITTWDGADAQHGGRVVAAGDARIHAEALAVLRSVP